MHVGLIVLGAVLLAGGGLLLRYPGAVARWQISSRIEAIRRSSVSNAKYVEREVQALRRPGSMRLSVWLVRVVGLCAAVLGVVAIVRGLAGG